MGPSGHIRGLRWMLGSLGCGPLQRPSLWWTVTINQLRLVINKLKTVYFASWLHQKHRELWFYYAAWPWTRPWTRKGTAFISQEMFRIHWGEVTLGGDLNCYWLQVPLPISPRGWEWRGGEEGDAAPCLHQANRQTRMHPLQGILVLWSRYEYTNIWLQKIDQSFWSAQSMHFAGQRMYICAFRVIGQWGW